MLTSEDRSNNVKNYWKILDVLAKHVGEPDKRRMRKFYGILVDAGLLDAALAGETAVLKQYRKVLDAGWTSLPESLVARLKRGLASAHEEPSADVEPVVEPLVERASESTSGKRHGVNTQWARCRTIYEITGIEPSKVRKALAQMPAGSAEKIIAGNKDLVRQLRRLQPPKHTLRKREAGSMVIGHTPGHLKLAKTFVDACGGINSARAALDMYAEIAAVFNFPV